MEHNASIDAVYNVIERIEQQKKRLTRNLMALSISALLGLVVNTFVFMILSHQKGALDNTTYYINYSYIFYMLGSFGFGNKEIHFAKRI